MKQNKRKYWYLIILLIVVCCIAVWAMLSGQIPITLNDLQYIINPSTEVVHSEGGIKLSIVEEVLFTMRMPRVMMAIGVGAALAICGAVMQSTVQNPLADPFLLGISSGASLGATVAIVLGIGIGVGGSVLSELGIPVMAFKISRVG